MGVIPIISSISPDARVGSHVGARSQGAMRIATPGPKDQGDLASRGPGGTPTERAAPPSTANWCPARDDSQAEAVRTELGRVVGGVPGRGLCRPAVGAVVVR